MLCFATILDRHELDPRIAHVVPQMRNESLRTAPTVILTVKAARGGSYARSLTIEWE
jgi:hypothetical protein